MIPKNSVILNQEFDELLQGVVDNLDFFLESIKCIKETYEFSEETLRAHHTNILERYNTIVSSFNQKEEDGVEYYIVPEGKLRGFISLQKNKKRAERAFELVPPSYFVSLISSYDAFFAGLIRCYYNICPEKLQECDITFNYRDLLGFGDLLEVKKRIIEKNIENLIRESHVYQIDWFAKALGVDTLYKFKGWSDFVELTERRNLFVHSNGTVSNQYINVCKKHSALNTDIIEGNKLQIDSQYFLKSYETLCKLSIMLTQMLLRTKYLANSDSNSTSFIDKILINNVFELIVDKHYDVAIDISEMVLNNPKFKHNAFDREYLVLNYAQAYKWKGDNSKCSEILGKEDWTACTNELLIPKYTLEENYTEVYRCMRELGKSNKRLNITAYREWPIFQLLRKEKDFESVFIELFGEKIETEKQFEHNKVSEKTSSTTSTI